MGKSLKQKLMCTQRCSLTRPRLTGELERPRSGSTGEVSARCHTSVHTSGRQSRAPNFVWQSQVTESATLDKDNPLPLEKR